MFCSTRKELLTCHYSIL